MAYFNTDTGKSSLIQQINELDDQMGTFQEIGLELTYEELTIILEDTTSRFNSAISAKANPPNGQYFYE